MQLLTQLVTVEYDGGEREVVPVEDIKVISTPGQKQKRDGARPRNADKQDRQAKQAQSEKPQPSPDEENQESADNNDA
jgi:hypothetical protein